VFDEALLFQSSYIFIRKFAIAYKNKIVFMHAVLHGSIVSQQSSTTGTWLCISARLGQAVIMREDVHDHCVETVDKVTIMQ
jgi:hypothetical protein